MVVAGMLNKQIAAELGIAESPVKVQRSRAMEKMHAASLADLIKMIEKVNPPSQRPHKPKLTRIPLLGTQKYQRRMDSGADPPYHSSQWGVRNDGESDRGR